MRHTPKRTTTTHFHQNNIWLVWKWAFEMNRLRWMSVHPRILDSFMIINKNIVYFLFKPLHWKPQIVSSIIQGHRCWTIGSKIVFFWHIIDDNFALEQINQSCLSLREKRMLSHETGLKATNEEKNHQTFKTFTILDLS